MSLEGKVAIITGGSLGIGKATAHLFAKEGAKVVINGRNEENLKKTISEAGDVAGDLEYVVGDVSKEEDCRNIVDYTKNKYGRVDILFNNAGVLPLGVTHETSVDDWDFAFNVNVKGSFLMAKYVIPHMIEQGGGSIVNNGSILGLKGIPGVAAYNSTKGAITQFTRSMALEYADKGIRVNCICPGAIQTPMLESFMSEEADQFLKQVQPLTAHLGRYGKPEEIAHSVKFLCDTENVGFMTGAMLSVDGGWIAN
ncbi:MAG: glucose 1-dehydrogenase [Candidatus Dadabacteria bacterium]|nr:glucose 1-dehydrogenase [Candidatus Dadabacteria bacterium]NIQ15492.1 glucose 1-dehydrogenase [Candidatus Dadabacteria bacterium]